MIRELKEWVECMMWAALIALAGIGLVTILDEWFGVWQ